MGFIYSITSPTGKLYVGKTYHIKKRIACHKCAAKKGSNIILHNSIKKYGWDQHLFTILEEVEDEQMDVREMYWIATLHTYCYENKMGLNMTRGGEGQRTTWMHDLDRRKQASERFSGVNNPFYGKKPTADVAKLISEKAKERALARGTRVPEWGAEKGRLIRSNKVAAYNLKGEFLGEFRSNAEAGRFYDISVSDVSAVTRGDQAHSGGRIFRNYDESYPLSINVEGVVFFKNKRAVLLLDKDGNIGREFTSSKDASKILGVSRGNITRGAGEYKGRPLRSGHRFVYKDEYEINQVINN